MRGTLKALRKKYGKDIRIVYRHLPLPQLHKFAIASAEASECAAEQGKFWPYHDLIFENASKLNGKMLVDLGKQAGLRDMKKFKACVARGKFKSLVREDTEAAGRLGMSGTPAFFIGRDVGEGMMEGEQLSGAQSLDAFVDIVDAVMASAR